MMGIALVKYIEEKYSFWQLFTDIKIWCFNSNKTESSRVIYQRQRDAVLGNQRGDLGNQNLCRRRPNSWTDLLGRWSLSGDDNCKNFEGDSFFSEVGKNILECKPKPIPATRKFHYGKVTDKHQPTSRRVLKPQKFLEDEMKSTHEDSYLKYLKNRDKPTAPG
jgi:hypothetical protein